MIVVAGTVHIDPTRQVEALALMQTMMEATQQEDGCITYQFYTNPWQPAEIFVFEEWASIEALNAHFATPHMATFRQHLPHYVTRAAAIKRYTIANMADL